MKHFEETKNLEIDRTASDQTCALMSASNGQKLRRECRARGRAFRADDGAFENRFRKARLDRVQNDRSGRAVEPGLPVLRERRNPLDSRGRRLSAQPRRQRNDAARIVAWR